MMERVPGTNLPDSETSDDVDTWLSMTSTRTWNWSIGNSDARLGTYTLKLRETNGNTVVSTATITLNMDSR